MVNLISPFVAAVAGLAIAESAYMAEIIRGGFLAIDRGHIEAATSMGLSRRQILSEIILPQLRIIIFPSIGNEYIRVLKSTSLAMTIGYSEVLRVVTDIYSSSYEVVELLSVAIFWYLVLACFVTILQHYLEKKFRYP